MLSNCQGSGAGDAGDAGETFTEIGVPVTFLLTSFYWDNLIYFGMGRKRDADGKLASHCPWATRSSRASPPRFGRCAPFLSLQVRRNR
jgi:hypothetical protein